MPSGVTSPGPVRSRPFIHSGVATLGRWVTVLFISRYGWLGAEEGVQTPGISVSTGHIRGLTGPFPALGGFLCRFALLDFLLVNDADTICCLP